MLARIRTGGHASPRSSCLLLHDLRDGLALRECSAGRGHRQRVGLCALHSPDSRGPAEVLVFLAKALVCCSLIRGSISSRNFPVLTRILRVTAGRIEQ
jgi:hypothetical protein